VRTTTEKPGWLRRNRSDDLTLAMAMGDDLTSVQFRRCAYYTALRLKSRI